MEYVNINTASELLTNDVIAAQQGDSDALSRLIEKTRNTVASIALAIVKDIDSSEEVAQQVFIAVWQQLSTLKSNNSFLPWIRQTTRYKAYNFLRDNKVSKKLAVTTPNNYLVNFAMKVWNMT
ncbi:MAG: RNA polymerase sigma factor [Exilibacterium sp.]